MCTTLNTINALVWAPRVAVTSGDRARTLMVVADIFRAKQRMSTLSWGLEKSLVGETEGAAGEQNFEMNKDGGAEEGYS